MKKTHKSLQAIVITLVIGILLPNIFTLTGNTLIDKLSFKITLSAIFSFSTFVVGGLYSFNIIKGRKSGGKARIIIYLILVILLCSVAMPFLIAFAQTIEWVIYFVGAVALIGIICLITILICKIVKSKKRFKSTQQQSLNPDKVKTSNLETKMSTLQIHSIYENADSTTNHNGNNKIIKPNNNKITIVTSNHPTESHDNKSTRNCFSLYELWQNRNPAKKCLTATNDENPDLDWVKIYKPPYGNGKFYGYVKMKNARNTVDGEIYFANRAIWREIE